MVRTTALAAIALAWVSGSGLANADLVAHLAERGVEVGQVGGRVRAVTHLDVSRADIERSLQVVREVMES